MNLPMAWPRIDDLIFYWMDWWISEWTEPIKGIWQLLKGKGMYFTFIAHLVVDKPHFKFSVALHVACGYDIGQYRFNPFLLFPIFQNFNFWKLLARLQITLITQCAVSCTIFFTPQHWNLILYSFGSFLPKRLLFQCQQLHWFPQLSISRSGMWGPEHQSLPTP